MSTYTATNPVNYGNLTIGASAATSGQVITVANGTGTTAINPTWATNIAKTTAKGQLHLEGEDADLVINGVKLSDILNGITDRLAILQPKPELLEKYENLREAYEHYKTLEALLHEESTSK